MKVYTEVTEQQVQKLENYSYETRNNVKIYDHSERFLGIGSDMELNINRELLSIAILNGRAYECSNYVREFFPKEKLLIESIIN